MKKYHKKFIGQELEQKVTKKEKLWDFFKFFSGFAIFCNSWCCSTSLFFHAT
jgi:hypothetical protein